MAVVFPMIGNWYRRSNGNLFEVVAVDPEDATIELQYYDGTLDEIDLDEWPELILESVGGPDDWSGSVDMDPDDFNPRDDSDIPYGYHDPLEAFDTPD